MKGLFGNFIAGAFLLIFVYLVVTNAGGVNQVLSSSSRAASDIFGTLQGRR